MSYPTLALASDPNGFMRASYSSEMEPAFSGGAYAASCTTCKDSDVPELFGRLGQFRPCCEDSSGNCSQFMKCADQCPSLGGGFGINLAQVKPVDNLTGNYCGYARNSKFVGQIGGVPMSLPVHKSF
jgi:hypothetical protein